MFGNGRQTIGVFVTHAYQEFQDTISRGICSKAKELGYNVAFFTNFVGYGEFQYEIGERGIADLPRYEDLSGIILMPDTMFVHGFEKSIRDNIKKNAHCPVVSIRHKIDEYYNVLVNDETVLDEIIYHFIVDHGYHKINFLTGPEDNPVSIARLNAYKRILSEHGIPIDERRIFYGDFWKIKPLEAVEYWMSDPELRPEAIVCANDYMAITVCNALTERGISVPGDIAVSGFDNITISGDFYPSITTGGMPIYDMGMEAVNKIHKYNTGVKQEQITFLNTKTILRESCGCWSKENQETITTRRNRMINEMENREKDISNNAFMSVDLTGIKTLDDLDHHLGSYTYMNEGFSDFYMFLHKDWEAVGDENHIGHSDQGEMVMEVGIKNGDWMMKEEFQNQLIASICSGPEPQFFFFNMLHYQERCFGYTAINFKEPMAYKHSYQGWLINICNALENIRMHNELNRLVYRLEDMYIKDDLTGLYNRRALEVLGQKYLKQSIEEHGRLMVFIADMDKLKFINDNYGHACGDIAIKAVARALEYAARDDEICMRVGGDEFNVIGLDYDQEKIEHYVMNFQEEIDRFNSEEGYEFKVLVSFGWCLILPNEHTTIEECIIIADSKMYQQKYEKETLRHMRNGDFTRMER